MNPNQSNQYPHPHRHHHTTATHTHTHYHYHIQNQGGPAAAAAAAASNANSEIVAVDDDESPDGGAVCFGLFRNQQQQQQQQQQPYQLQYPPTAAAATARFSAAPLVQQQQKVANNNNNNYNGNDTKQKQSTSDDVDSVLHADFGKLTIQERERTLDELHGVPAAVEETPESIQKALQALQECLDTHPNASNPTAAYNIAKSKKNANYVNTPKFQLLFLRADRFLPQLAADRMYNFFEEKKRLFGIDKLVKETITLEEDFNEEDMNVLKSGFYQICPLKDMAGRKVIVHLKKLRTGVTNLDSVDRVIFYMTMLLYENDEESQKKGTVAIIYSMDMTAPVFPRLALRHALPGRVAGSHLCTDARLQFLFLSVISSMPTRHRAKVRLHYGSHLEVQYSMMSYGIPVKALPITSTGILLTQRHLDWVHDRQRIEASSSSSSALQSPQQQSPFVAKNPSGTSPTSSSSSSIIITPQSQDVLCKMKKSEGYKTSETSKHHPGNVYLADLVAKYSTAYDDDSTADTKRVISAIIVDKIKETSGRFLMPSSKTTTKTKKMNSTTTTTSTSSSGTTTTSTLLDNIVWEEMTDHDARLKITNDFRNLRKRKMKKK